MIDSSVQIRTARESELAYVRRVFLKVLKELQYYNALAKKSESKKYTVSRLSHKLREDRYSILCALDESGEIVGFLFSHFDDYTIWLDWFGVLKNARKKGTGTLLLEALFKTARVRGCHKVWCDCRTTNGPSKAALRGAGFRRIAQINDHWYRQDFILWERFV
ncbi:MAG TPA: GNAT family N-acetyltransferase [Nitrososphaerales archaeon]|nr:GNAT family N-acetyltransferase [Nitrososphaerales archaeon]